MAHLFVVAIDFGTTYSGYAYSSKNDFQNDPLRVNASIWRTGSHSLMSLKTPSCILFRPDKSFDVFGAEAEDKYSDLSYDNEHKSWFYFRRFKMQLYNSKNVHRSTMIKDESGNEMLALDVFSAAIGYLKDHAMGSISNQVGQLDTRDIRWVLTVPAIWDDAAKQFMREAATRTGIPDQNLKLSLEPEAASMYCKYLPVERLVGSDDRQISCFKPKSKYLVLDAGGGTVDITVHEVLPNLKLKELDKANGGAWGGTSVDKAFIQFLKTLTNDTFIDEFRDLNQEDYMDMLREFEVKKRQIRQEMDTRMTFKMPISLYEFYREKFQRELRDDIKEKTQFDGKVTLAGDKMRVDPEVAKGLFAETCSSITDHLKKILTTPIAKDTMAILMVGGFSESPMLQDAVKNAFPDRKVIVPNDAGLAVLKGAVIFGHDDGVITSRIAKYTYGLKMYQTFDSAIHDPNRKVKIDGKSKVQGIFSKLVEVGQPVCVEDQLEKTRYSPVRGAEEFTIKLYSSNERNPMYVDDPSCTKIGEVTVNCRNKRGKVGSAAVWLVFGGTELEVHAETDDGERTQASFDFLA